ncbi:MAG: DUF523 domain-containing protein [Sphaerochaeta sp.]|nr:DUF523 domain-containing protein [Sphaerochaeta sp.]
MKKLLLVSSCLLGYPCRYNGTDAPFALRQEVLENHEVIAVCPEVLGGLSTPRPCAERVGDRVLNQAGEDVTPAFAEGARIALQYARKRGCTTALLMERSPSCGYGMIYDGSFSSHLIPGNGVFAQLLEDEGFTILTPKTIGGFLDTLGDASAFDGTC